MACISGRSAAEARRLVGVGGIAYAGSHGAELLEPGAATPRVIPAFKSWERRVRRFAGERDTPELRTAAGADRGQGADRRLPLARRARRGGGAHPARRRIAHEAETDGLAIHWGRKVLEVRPPVPIDKGHAVRDLVHWRRASRRSLRR